MDDMLEDLDLLDSVSPEINIDYSGLPVRPPHPRDGSAGESLDTLLSSTLASRLSGAFSSSANSNSSASLSPLMNLSGSSSDSSGSDRQRRSALRRKRGDKKDDGEMATIRAMAKHEEAMRRQERYLANLEHCNAALSSSVDVLTKTNAIAERKVKDLEVQVGELQAALRKHRDGMEALEKACHAEKEKAAKLEAELRWSKSQARTPMQERDMEDYAKNVHQENQELKENLKAVAQLMLSSVSQMDQKTMQLLEILTAPVGGLSGVGSRTGVLGLPASKGHDAVSRSIPTAMTLMGVPSGPVAETDVPKNTLSSILQPSSRKSPFNFLEISFGGTCAASTSPSSKLLSVTLCIGIMVIASDRIPQQGQQQRAHSRKLLQVEPAADDSMLFGTAQSVLSFVVLLLGSLLLSVLLVASVTRALSALHWKIQDIKGEPLLPSKKSPEPSDGLLSRLWSRCAPSKRKE